MKILHVLAQLPAKTGSGVYFSNLVENLSRYDHDQRAIFALQDDFQWNLLEDEHIYPVEFKNEELNFPIVGMSNVIPYDNTLYSQMSEEMFQAWIGSFRKKLEEVKREFTPDIIFAHHLWILTSLVIEVFPDSKIVGVFHNTDMRQAQMNPEIYKKYVKDFHKLDLVFAGSEDQKDLIVETYRDIKKEDIIAIGGGFNQEIFYPAEEKETSDKIRLVYAAKIDPSKGIYELLKVYKELNLDDVSLDIIGSPDEEGKKELEKYIQGDESIRVYNVKDQAALGDELRRKDIFLMPSFYEGLGLMAIESLATGLYVVTTEIEALMSLLGEEIKASGVIKYVPLPRIYDVDKPVEKDLRRFRKDLRDAILEQIEKIRNKDGAIMEQRENIEKFSWPSLVDRINGIIKEL